jgi:putative transcriptional regulator
MAPSIRETPANTNGKSLHCRLRQIMGEKNNMRMQELCNLTNLRRNTISALYNNKATRIDTITITAICTALECTPGDLFALEGGGAST